MTFDPFGDFETRGYLRNVATEKDPDTIKRLEHHAFAANVATALAELKTAPVVRYEDLLAAHRRLFSSVYPWAGQDRAALAPKIAIGKGGVSDLFAHPADVRRAVEYGLEMARDAASMRRRYGEAFGALAYAHPFLDGNGRTLMTVHADLARRAGFHIAWQNVKKAEFLSALTAELRAPGQALKSLLDPHIRPGALPIERAAADLKANRAFAAGASSSP